MLTADNTSNTNALEVAGVVANKALAGNWKEVQISLHKEYGDSVFKNWILPITFNSASNKVLDISVPTRFMRDWVKTHYAESIRKTWSNKFDVINHVDVSISSSSKVEKTNIDILTKAVSSKEKTPDISEISSPLDPRFTFKNFVVGKSNQLSYSTAVKIAKDEEVSFNPLFIYGGVGLGKTHLMHAVAQSIRENTPERKVLFMSAEKFMYQFVQAIRAKDTMVFKEQFRSVDILMIDDIQFICGKESTQEEFFHTFNALVDNNKQIIISSNKPPSDLDGLDERLRSRLGGGLASNILPSDYNLRLNILKKKCELLKRNVPSDVLEFLADKIVSNIRELEGALNRLIAHTDILKCEINLETTQDLLKDILRASNTRISIEEIQKHVATKYNIRVSDLHSSRRAKAIARPRQIAMYLCKMLTQHSFPEIGRKFGGRDHTTIMYGVRKIEELAANDDFIQADIDVLTSALKG